MQSSASKRVLSTLASKIHPQLPLSPRESQQLLNLLTTSFRAHLDREHPVPDATKSSRKSLVTNAPRSRSPARMPSSHVSTSKHIESILSNPLFSVKPHRRASEPAAVEVLRDPSAWFLAEVAAGSATLTKAMMCLDLQQSASRISPKSHSSLALAIAEWLRTSGTDSSREFISFNASKQGRSSKFLDNLIATLFAEGHSAVVWRWYIRSPDQLIKSANLDLYTILNFKKSLLLKMVSTQANVSMDEGLGVFLQAYRMAQAAEHASSFEILKPAGAHLVDRFTATPEHTTSPDPYQSFLQSTQSWLGDWARAVQATLWLHHPTAPSAAYGLQYIQDSDGAISYAHSSRSRRKFLVQLCLGVARQLMETEQYEEAQTAMEFTKTHFSDLVLSPAPVPNQEQKSQRREEEEKRNLALLDGLIPT